MTQFRTACRVNLVQHMMVSSFLQFAFETVRARCTPNTGPCKSLFSNDMTMSVLPQSAYIQAVTECALRDRSL